MKQAVVISRNRKSAGNVGNLGQPVTDIFDFFRFRFRFQYNNGRAQDPPSVSVGACFPINSIVLSCLRKGISQTTGSGGCPWLAVE